MVFRLKIMRSISANLVPRASFPLTSGRKTRALGATISGMRHRCRWAVSRITRIRLFPLFYGACLKWLLPELSFSDRWSRGTKLWERDWISAVITAHGGQSLQTSTVLFLFLKWRNYFFGTENGKEKHKSMFRWSQNGRSRCTEISNLSGEEFFLPSTATKT